MGKGREAAKEFTKGFAKGASTTLGYGTAGAHIGLLCGGPPGALVGWAAGCAVAMVALATEDDTVKQVGEGAQKVAGATSLYEELINSN